MNLPGFQQIKVLGRGTYGCVYKATRNSDGKTYAVKVVNLGALNHREIEDSVNEIRLMASFTSPFIIRFYEAFCDRRRLCIVTEYSRLGDLSHLIERRKAKGRPFKEELIWTFLIQILEGLRVLHSVGVVHRDLKSANILMSAPDFIKIADLGVSTVLHSTQLARTQIGTPLYLAPEIWKHKAYDQCCDMWSLGVLLYEMMTFNFPFHGKNNNELAQRVCMGRFSIPRGYSNELTMILRRLLQVNPLMRPTVNDLFKLQCIKSRMHLISNFLKEDVELNTDQLLSTIKIPGNLRNVNLPDAAYNKKVDIVKPMEERIHMKQGIPFRKDFGMISSPELQIVTDHDWWSPIKVGSSYNQQNQEKKEIEFIEERPMTSRPLIQRNRPGMPRQVIQPRNIHVPKNPKIKRVAIR
ncbi:AGC family protein kinase [Tritrichomonas foetus]|uniref:non-specific serine/threonine protein kinase n=1 Tax=Tritrichomonas foetus TaxID=1144522 RepID=A0A1J4JFN7_9EUKA|nr:AGC family protein kinase [Tritrichomonas foetus]|eukprot:OHS97928.1 AGC family protein kinase [Tritrichomonas foetus]